MKLGSQLNRLPGEAIVNWKQAEDFFTNTTSSFQAATQDFRNTSSDAMQNAIAQARSVTGFASSLDLWLQAHPIVFRLFNTIIWAIDRPVISFIAILLLIAITFSIIKALNRLLEMVGLSLLQAPFKLVKTGWKLTWLGSLGIQKKFINKNIMRQDISIITPENSQQRLAEISLRVQVLQKEQNELLQEAATILALNSLQ